MTTRRQRGLSLVGLLVGTALMLLVAAATALLVAGHWKESRSQLVQARLTQDLRVTLDLMASAVRRSAYWADAGAAVWQPGMTAPLLNPYGAVPGGVCTTSNTNEAAYCLSRDGSEDGVVSENEQFGFRRNPTNQGQLDMKLGHSNWQALTDPGNLRVSAFRMASVQQTIDLEALCGQPCEGAVTACPPRQHVVVMEIAISAASVADPGILGSASRRVHLRNGLLSGACDS